MTMNKTQATDLGRAAGLKQAEAMMNETFLREVTPEQIEAKADEYATFHCAEAKIRSIIYSASYKGAFLSVYRNRRSELPEVVAERRLSYLTHRLADMIASGEDTIDKFKEKLTANPAYAFEWAQGAIEAAAKLDVAIRLQGILTHENGGFDAVMKNALREALRGARNPSHSTSTVSNLVDEAKTAAYAEIADLF